VTTAITRRNLSYAAIAAQLVFIGGWLVGGAIEGHGYSAGRHDVSDLGALTAHHVPLALVTLLLSGLLTAAFALGALRPAFGAAGALVALSLVSLDNTSDAFFRLDCRAADAGCSMSDAASSWHGKVHIAVFALAALATVAAPFLLARRMRTLDAWRDFARKTQLFGVAFIVGLVLTAATAETDIAGWTQRGLILFTCAGMCALAWKTAEG
jgi:MYXO-CTERM domain-containing protein